MLEVACPQCHMPNPANASFCTRCGAGLAGDPGVAAPDASGWELATAGIARPATMVPGTGPLQKDECAGWWQRFGASFLDGFIGFLVVLPLWAAIAVLAGTLDPTALEEFGDSFGSGSDFSDRVYMWFGVVAIATLVFWISWEVWWTRSTHMAKPGQSIAGFRVVRVDGIEHLSTGRSFGRALAKLLYNIPNLGSLIYLATAITIGVSEKKQSVHDMISGSACVRKSALALRGVGPDAQDQAEPSHGFPPAAPGPPPPSPAMPQPPSSGPFV